MFSHGAGPGGVLRNKHAYTWGTWAVDEHSEEIAIGSTKNLSVQIHEQIHLPVELLYLPQVVVRTPYMFLPATASEVSFACDLVHRIEKNQNCSFLWNMSQMEARRVVYCPLLGRSKASPDFYSSVVCETWHINHGLGVL